MAFAGLLLLAEAVVSSELLLPAAHTLPPPMLYSELANPRDMSSTFPQPPELAESQPAWSKAKGSLSAPALHSS